MLSMLKSPKTKTPIFFFEKVFSFGKKSLTLSELSVEEITWKRREKSFSQKVFFVVCVCLFVLFCFIWFYFVFDYLSFLSFLLFFLTFHFVFSEKKKLFRFRFFFFVTFRTSRICCLIFCWLVGRCSGSRCVFTRRRNVPLPHREAVSIRFNSTPFPLRVPLTEKVCLWVNTIGSS